MIEGKSEVGILGAGGQAREVEQYLDDQGIKPTFFAVDAEYVGDSPGRIDILSPTEFEAVTPVIAAIGAPEVRRQLVKEWKGGEFYTVIANEAYVGESVTIGEGSIIAPRAVLTASIEVGSHVIVNVGATISHDCVIGDFATISPGAHVAGSVELGPGVFVGIGATISNGVKVAEGSVIGAGAVVIKDVVEKNSVVVGVPGGVIRINEGWLSEV